jgi:hypothetical protein
VTDRLAEALDALSRILVELETADLDHEEWRAIGVEFERVRQIGAAGLAKLAPVVVAASLRGEL